jgi:hypothetical protein
MGRFRRGVQPEDPGDSASNMNQALPVGKVSDDHEVIVVVRLDFEYSRIAIDDDRSHVAVLHHVLDSGDGTTGEMRDHRVPVERSVERQPQRKTPIGDEPISPASLRPQFGWGRSEHPLHHSVHLTYASKARRIRNVRDAEIGVIQKSSREMRPARTGQIGWGYSKMLMEQSSKVSRRNSEFSSKAGLGRAVQAPVEDHSNCTTHNVWPGLV